MAKIPRHNPAILSNLKTLLFVFLCSTGLVSFSQDTGNTKSINISSGEWPPLISEKLPNGGNLTEITTQAFKNQHISPKYDYYPWARSLEAAKSGISDATLGWMYNVERAKHFYFSDPIMASDEVFILLKSKSLNIDTFEDLKGLTIAGIRNYSYGDKFDAAETNNFFTVIKNKEHHQNLKMLLSNRADLVIAEKAIIKLNIKNNLSEKEQQMIKIIPSSLPKRYLYLLFSKNAPHTKGLLKDFNIGLIKYKTSLNQ